MSHKPAHKKVVSSVKNKEDFLADRVSIGDKVKLGDATFVMKAENTLQLFSASGALAPYVSKHTHVFVRRHQITDRGFVSPLTGETSKKQLAMLNHIRQNLGEKGLSALGCGLSPEGMVGESQTRWLNADSNLNEALNAVTRLKQGTLRVGKIPSEGVVFSFTYSNNADMKGILVSVVHVGSKHTLAGKIPLDSLLHCDEGKMPNSINVFHTPANKKLLGGKALLNYIHDFPTEMRNALEKGILITYRRISENRQQDPPLKPIVETPHQEQEPQSAAPHLHIVPVSTTPQSEELSTVAPPAPTQEKVNLSTLLDIPGFMQGMRETGASTREIGLGVAVYMNSGATNDLAHLVSGMKQGDASAYQIGIALAHHLKATAP